MEEVQVGAMTPPQEVIRRASKEIGPSRKRRRLNSSPLAHSGLFNARNFNNKSTQKSNDDDDCNGNVEVVKVQSLATGCAAKTNKSTVVSSQLSRAMSFGNDSSDSSEEEIEVIKVVRQPVAPVVAKEGGRKDVERKVAALSSNRDVDHSLAPVMQQLDHADEGPRKRRTISMMLGDESVIDLTGTTKKFKSAHQQEDLDAAMARALAEADKAERKAAEARDAEVARVLDDEFKKKAKFAETAKVVHQAEMLKTPTGKAWKFVEGVLAVHARLVANLRTKASPNFIKPVATDDIVALTERLLVKQEEFRKAGKPFHIDLGFHYTQPQNLKSIQTGGLLTKQERDSQSINAAFNGSALGDGIYTAQSPADTWNKRYGNVGLIVARLQGNSGRMSRHDQAPGTVDTVVSGSFVALRTSAQCVALVQFNGTELTFNGPTCPSTTVLAPFYEGLQELINNLLNVGVTPVPQVQPTKSGWTSVSTLPIAGPPASLFGRAGNLQAAGGPRLAFGKARAPSASSSSTSLLPGTSSMFQAAGAPTAPRTTVFGNMARAPSVPTAPSIMFVPIPYQMPANTTSQHILSLPVQSYATVVMPGAQSHCSVCLRSSARTQLARLNTCGHELHKKCLRQWLGNCSRCPTCRQPIAGTPLGKMPSGTMAATRLRNQVCAGYKKSSSLQITYHFPSGTQQQYHPNPGKPYAGTTRVAYLPDNPEGRRLLWRLQEAFRHGLTFDIGTSLGSGVQNTITWVSIPHKTNLVGGVSHDGFPDPKYFENCNQALDALHVKAAS